MSTSVQNVILSFYYPHTELKVFIDNCLKDLHHKLNETEIAPDYLLSSYKGENITLFMHGSKEKTDHIKDIVSRKADFFLEKHAAAITEPELPINQFFLNFQPNTVHVWNVSPFRKFNSLSGSIDNDLKIRAEISTCCIHIISQSENWSGNTIFYLFLDLIVQIGNHAFHDHSRDFRIFLKDIVDFLYSEKSNQIAEIDNLCEKGGMIYQKNEKAFDNHIGSIQTKSNPLNERFIPAQISSSISKISPIINRSGDKIWRTILLEFKNRISLRLNEFVMAVGVLRVYIEKRETET